MSPRLLSPKRERARSHRRPPDGALLYSPPLGVGRAESITIGALPGVQGKAGRARRAPAGYYPANELYRHVVMAGSVLCCLACGTEAQTTVSSRVDPARYNHDVEAFVARHKGCRDAA